MSKKDKKRKRLDEEAMTLSVTIAEYFIQEYDIVGHCKNRECQKSLRSTIAYLIYCLSQELKNEVLMNDIKKIYDLIIEGIELENPTIEIIEK